MGRSFSGNVTKSLISRFVVDLVKDPCDSGSLTTSTTLKRFESELISPEEAALWKRGASNAGYHYLGCAKTFAQMGQAFAEVNLAMLKK